MSAPLDSSADAAEQSTTISATSDDLCLVQTTIGPVKGFTDSSFPRVRQWLGVPFAEPPVAERRFARPTPKSTLPKGEIFLANKMPPAPMQAYTTRPDIHNKYTPEFLASGPYSEDCLYLNVFAPLPKTKEPLPTLVFFYGGQGEWGGINTEYLQPHAWVERSQAHIVVLFNWRLGVFGFPNAKGLGQGQPGIFDQRLALEFIRDNIQSFGGSATRLVAFGAAAGSACIDTHLFAWPDDPIISAAVCFSGSLIGTTSQDMAQESFPRLARRLGCPENATPEQEVDYVRNVDAGAMIGCFRAYNDSGAEPMMFFRPQVDGSVIFTLEDQLNRARQGKFAKVPLLLGMTTDEGNALVDYRELVAGKDSAVSAAAGVKTRFESLLNRILEYRVENGCTTYRCLYAGDFPNVSPRPWMKAYHISEVPMIMGTYEIERRQPTDFQRQLSAAMQDMWVAFARDPERGLDKWQWQPASRETLEPMVLGKNGVLLHQEGKPRGDMVVVGGKQKSWRRRLTNFGLRKGEIK